MRQEIKCKFKLPLESFSLLLNLKASPTYSILKLLMSRLYLASRYVADPYENCGLHKFIVLKIGTMRLLQTENLRLTDLSKCSWTINN